MQKLMTKFDFKVDKVVTGGCNITVTKLANKEEKVFFLAGNSDIVALENFMCSITDDQADGYFPKPKKEKPTKVT